MATQSTTETETLFPVAEAASRCGISRQAFIGRLRARGIVPIRRVIDGHARTFVTLEQLAAAMDCAVRQSPATATPKSGVAASESAVATPKSGVARSAIAAADSDELAQLRRALADAEAARVKAEAILAAAERIERSTAARCDKLEARLDAAIERNAQVRSELAASQASAEHFRNTAQALMLTENRQHRIAAGRRWWPFG
jgi:methylmalonyl-CoA mutase cobalamin-binding subunit